MYDENVSPRGNDTIHSIPCNDRTLTRPLARKAADALKLNHHKSVFEFLHKPKKSNSSDHLQQKWFNTMLKDSSDDDPETTVSPRVSTESYKQKSPSQRMKHLMGSFRHKRNRSSASSDTSQGNNKAINRSSLIFLAGYDPDSIPCSSKVHSSPVYHSSPIPIPDHKSICTAIPTPYIFSTPHESDDVLSRQVSLDNNSNCSPSLGRMLEPMTPSALRDSTMSPLPGTVFPLEDTDQTPQPTKASKELYKHKGYVVCDALDGHLDDLVGLKKDKSRISFDDTFGANIGMVTTSTTGSQDRAPTPTSPLEKGSSLFLTKPQVHFTPRKGDQHFRRLRPAKNSEGVDANADEGSFQPVTREDDAENGSTWKEFLAESKRILQRRRTHSEGLSFKGSTLGALRDCLSEHRFGTSNLSDSSREHISSDVCIVEAKNSFGDIFGSNYNTRDTVEAQNSRKSDESTTLKEVSSLKHQDSTVRLISIPPSEALNGFCHTIAASESPSVDRRKIEEKIDTEFTHDDKGFHPVKWSKLPATQGWYTENANTESWKSGMKYKGNRCWHSPPHSKESSTESDDSASVRLVWRRPTSVDSILSEDTSVYENEFHDNGSMIENIMNRARAGDSAVD